MSQITTHILDTARGRPAQGVPVFLFQEEADTWTEIAAGITDGDGRVSGLLKENDILEKGNYKIRFETAGYFEQSNRESFYPFVEIVFTLTGKDHYHIPLLITSFGYTTYRGS